MKERELRRVLTTLVLFSGLLSCISTAQETSDHRPNRIIIHAGKLLEVKTGKTLSDQGVVIEGDKIVSVGPMAQVQRSTGDRLTDLPNATVLPGLTEELERGHVVLLTVVPPGQGRGPQQADGAVGGDQPPAGEGRAGCRHDHQEESGHHNHHSLCHAALTGRPSPAVPDAPG